MDYVDVSSDFTKEIIIMATNACNLHCKYCYESNKNATSMQMERTRHQIEQELSKTNEPYNHFVINFHGGEPFLVFNKIKEIIQWVDNTFTDLSISYTTTTNGTVLNDDIRSWLVDNRKRFIPVLSLDGPKEIHNRNRTASFERIDLDFFRSNWPLQGVKMTICPNTVEDMFHSFEYLYSIGFYPNPTLAKEVDWDLSIHLPLYAHELKKLTDFYISHPFVPPGQLLNLPLYKFSEDYNAPGINTCGAGFDTIAFDIYGNRYPCQAFITDLGKQYDEEEIGKVFCALGQNCHLKLSPKCAGCPIINACSSCYAMNYVSRGDMGAIDEVMCQFNKLTFLASASMFAEIIPNHKEYPWLKYRTDAEFYNMIKGIKQLFNTVTI